MSASGVAAPPGEGATTPDARQLRLKAAQRRRLLEAMVELSCAQRRPASVAQVTARARVSRRTFYELFGGSQECFMATLEDAVARAAARLRLACEHQRDWADRMRGGLRALLEFFDQEPQLARVCLILAPAGGPPVLALRRDLVARLAAHVDEGRALSRRKPPALTAEFLVGGVLSVLHARLLAGSSEPLASLMNPVMAFIVQPYLGGTRARLELMRPPPRAAPREAADERAKPDRPPIRLTHRTLPALLEIAARPGVSNQDVAAAAGIADEGQISRLLARLKEAGLIVNTAAGKPRGATNAWNLTASGRALVQRIRRESRQLGGPRARGLLERRRAAAAGGARSSPVKV